MTATKLHTQDAAVSYQENKNRAHSQHRFTHLQTSEVKNKELYTVCNMIAMTTLTLGRCVLIISQRARVDAEFDKVTQALLPPTWAHSTHIHTHRKEK